MLTLWHLLWTLLLILGAFALFLGLIFVLLLFVMFCLEDKRDLQAEDDIKLQIDASERHARTGLDY